MSHDQSADLSTVEPASLSIHGQELETTRPSRRQAMQWVLAAVAASSMPAVDAWAQPAGPAAKRPSDRTGSRQEGAAEGRTGGLVDHGYGQDPDLKKNYLPGDLWPLTFNEAQKKTATSLADTIIPEDKLGPAASDVGVVEMLDEWISSPYPAQEPDRPIMLEGLAWIEAESQKRFTKGFADLGDEQKAAICDDICFAPKAKAPFQKAANFFSRFRTLCAGAYYSTPAGWKAVGYVGNVQLARFDGPPAKVLEQLGVTQTVR
jgi:hypothetical protein